MERGYKTSLDTLFGGESSIRDSLPAESYGVRFIGYDSSGTGIDPKGVLRVSFSSEPGSDLMKLFSHDLLSTLKCGVSA